MYHSSQPAKGIFFNILETDHFIYILLSTSKKSAMRYYFPKCNIKIKLCGSIKSKKISYVDKKSTE